jgi:phosphohistidine phosphatase
VKTLYLLRHAKSSWDQPGLNDHERDLNERGRRDAPRMGAALAERLAPQIIHCSTALRARQTLAGLCDGWPAIAGLPHLFHEALYTFDYRGLLRWLQAQDDQSVPSAGTVGKGENSRFIIAHNPGLTDLCNQLCGRRALDNLPTAGFLALELEVSRWGEVVEGCGELVDYQFPRDLPK